MFSMCCELTPLARIPDTRIPQLMQPWSTPGVLPRITLYLTCYRLKQTEGDEVRGESETGQVSVGPWAAWTSGKDCEWWQNKKWNSRSCREQTMMQNNTFNKTQSSMSESFLSNLSLMSSRSASFVSNISNMSIRNLRIRQHLRIRLRRIKRIGKL